MLNSKKIFEKSKSGSEGLSGSDIAIKTTNVRKKTDENESILNSKKMFEKSKPGSKSLSGSDIAIKTTNVRKLMRMNEWSNKKIWKI